MTSSNLFNTRIVQNFHLVWLDENMDETKAKYRDSLTKLHQVINTVNVFDDIDRCVDFITDTEETTFMILSGKIDKSSISILFSILQVSHIYIFCENESEHGKYPEVSGIYTNITSICEALKQTAYDHDHNASPISIVKKVDGTVNQNLNTLNPSFMYTQMLKEILLSLDFNEDHVKDFLIYCRAQFACNTTELRHINKIEKDYDGQQAIRWYTYQCFLYSMLNKALRTMEANLLVNMGFFIRDLHNHITTLYSQQFGKRDNPQSFVVYRGQGLSQIDFDQLRETPGGLLAFNNFLSTSLKRDVSLRFARQIINRSTLVGILFVMKIDPMMSTTAFANIKDVSSYGGEEEILFSMHSVFRIGSVEKIDKNDRLWQVNLTLSNDNDSQLLNLMKIIKGDLGGPITTGWFQLGSLMMKVAQFDKAEQLFGIILNQTTDELMKGYIYHELGSIKSFQGKFQESITYYEKTLEVRQNTLPANHPELAALYSNIGVAYDGMKEYQKALSYYEKDIKILQQITPIRYRYLATCYGNIGVVLNKMGQYSNALSYFQQALEIQQEVFPANHPELAFSYTSIGSAYNTMGEYSKALLYHQKALEIRSKSLPENHPDLGISYNSIGLTYQETSQYSNALLNFQKALQIRQDSLSTNHPDVGDSCSNMGLAYYNMGEYSKALLYHQKALTIRQASLSSSHPDVGYSCDNIGLVYYALGEYLKALSYYEKALKIQRKALSENHPSLANLYIHIGVLYFAMREYLVALSYFNKGLEIQQSSLPPNHYGFTASYNNIGVVYRKMGDYNKSLSYYNRALEMHQKLLPEKHPDLAASYNNIGEVYTEMGDYDKSLSYYNRALEIQQKILPEKHPDLATSYNNIGLLYYNIGEYPTAVTYFMNALDILQHSLPPSHPLIQKFKYNYEAALEKL